MQKIERIKIMHWADGVSAMFDTRNEAEGPDKGGRVKHIIYRDPDSRAIWHEQHYLCHDIDYRKPTYVLQVSERLFFGKVRLVRYRSRCLPETYLAIARCVETILKVEKQRGL